MPDTTGEGKTKPWSIAQSLSLASSICRIRQERARLGPLGRYFPVAISLQSMPDTQERADESPGSILSCYIPTVYAGYDRRVARLGPGHSPVAIPAAYT
ncbi:hypothetical protein AVEN_112690-1 [Araneus ventricosus]|uniref:Uncharacterized protein n=1 Tax=Araneus ventricosus TaxID=182803 RepID=A0A4Y2SXU8_ARAVE|nr:hypothetical protein AVEN_112690-1 [Araneus ventricosus]